MPWFLSISLRVVNLEGCTRYHSTKYLSSPFTAKYFKISGGILAV